MNSRMAKTMIFFLIVLISLILGYFLPLPIAKKVFEISGYYFIFVASITWAFTFLRRYRLSFLTNLRGYSIIIIFCTLITGAMFLASPPEYKVLTDEANLMGTSMLMHQDKIAAIPIKAFTLDNGSTEYDFIMDRRPLLFPFLISVVHAITGYSPFNGFVVNFFAGVLILCTFYLLVSKMYDPTLGLIAILIISALPQYMFCITSSGFDALNLLFIILSLFMLHQFVRSQSAANAELFLFTLLLLAYCRYESVLFIICLMVLIPFIKNRDVIFKCSLILYVIPPLLIPVLWQRRYFDSITLVNKIEPGLFHSPENQFSFAHFITHVPKNVFVLLGVDPNYGYSWVAAILAISGAYLFARRRLLTREISTSENRALLIYSVATFGALFGLISAYFWGNFTLAVNNRLSLIFLPCIVLPAIYVIDGLLLQKSSWVKNTVAVFFVFHLACFWPYGIKQKLGNTMMLKYEYEVTLQMLNESFDREKNLIVANYPHMYNIQKFNAVDFNYANSNIQQMVKSRHYDHIIVFQRYQRNKSRPVTGNTLDIPYELNTLEEFKLSEETILKISELIPEQEVEFNIDL
ncbi:ArnT family glycosyltransferase [Thermodesulfobacteriota bacterium]